MKKYISHITMGLLGVFFIASTLAAATDDQTPERKHIPVGISSDSHAERVKIQEEKAALAKKIEDGAELTEDEQTLVNEENLAKRNISAKKSLTNKKSTTVYYTSHEGAYHVPFAVSLFGDTVELEDGSIWNVCSYDRYKTLDWMTSDLIIVVPNQTWFSSYNYKMININTGAEVQVNLAFWPVFNGIFTHWIIAIDRINLEICLEDGSVWSISSWDRSTFNEWLPNDTVIIGHNNGLFKQSNPNILINVRKDNFVIGNCLN